MQSNLQDLINFSKDVLYLIGSVLGIIGFIRTLKKREYCSLNYKTDFGNEIEPYLVCVKANIYNLTISDSERAISVQRFRAGNMPSYHSRIEVPLTDTEVSSFFLVLKEQDFFVINNKKLNLEKLLFSYEDIYGNKYRQEFSFDKSEIDSVDRLKRTNRSFYRLTARKYRILFIWFPLYRRYI